MPLGAERELQTAQYVMGVCLAAQNSVLAELQLNFNNASNEKHRKRQAKTPTIAGIGLRINDHMCKTAAVSANTIGKQSCPPPHSGPKAQ